MQRALDRLGRAHPRAYRVAEPSGRALARVVGRPLYWDARKGLRYYRVVEHLARRHVPEGGSVIDVGAFGTDLLMRFDWFESRVALDIRYMAPRSGIETVVCDFQSYEPDRVFDLVLCLQVLEHTPAPELFANKLLTMGRTVILSVPYRWPAELHAPHVHDPVDHAKLGRWTSAAPLESTIVDDGRERLIAVYRGRPEGHAD